MWMEMAEEEGGCGRRSPFYPCRMHMKGERLCFIAHGGKSVRCGLRYCGILFSIEWKLCSVPFADAGANPGSIITQFCILSHKQWKFMWIKLWIY